MCCRRTGGARPRTRSGCSRGSGRPCRRVHVSGIGDDVQLLGFESQPVGVFIVVGGVRLLPGNEQERICPSCCYTEAWPRREQLCCGRSKRPGRHSGQPASAGDGAAGHARPARRSSVHGTLPRSWLPFPGPGGMGPARPCLPDTSMRPPPNLCHGGPSRYPSRQGLPQRQFSVLHCWSTPWTDRKARTMRLPRTAPQRCDRAGAAPRRMQRCAIHRDPYSHAAPRTSRRTGAPSGPRHRRGQLHGPLLPPDAADDRGIFRLGGKEKVAAPTEEWDFTNAEGLDPSPAEQGERRE